MNTNTKQASPLRLAALAIGGLFLTGSMMAQAVRPDTPEAKDATSSPLTVNAKNRLIDDDIIMMSPFQVDATREKGYFAENTLAGSRMRTNIADLGAAISVVTKRQMEDTASLDINDVFRYEIGTEGATTYTPVANGYSSSRKDGLADNIAGSNSGGGANAATNATANRVRGLGAPSMAINYYQAIDQIPFDSYNTSSVEINRGPNSMLFGMGSPAGIVNQSTAQASLIREEGQVQIRIDNYGSNRASLSYNLPLIRNKLAVYLALLYNDQQFERKPSYDMTRRQYATLTYKPFKTTTIRASIEGYNNDNRRPNSLSPVDGVTEWRNAGKPVYNAQTHEIISMETGQVMSMLANSANSTNAQAVKDFVTAKVGTLPSAEQALWNPTANTYNGISIYGIGAITNVNSILYAPAIAQHATRTVMQIADGELQGWFQPLSGNRPVIGWNGATAVYPFGSSAATDVYPNPTWANIYDWFQTESTVFSMEKNPPYAGNKFYPAVTDRSVYDWKDVNILSMNFGWQRATNYNVEIEQEIIPNLLHLSAGWFRQDFDSMQSYTVSQLNSARLYVDTNLLNSDGTPNPYVGRPFVYDQDLDRMYASETTDQYRAMLAFTPDFTKNKGWSRWLGRHQILGLASYYDQERTTMRRRLAYTGGSQEGKYRYMNNPNASSAWNMENSGPRRYFYLSDGGEAVNKAAGEYSDGPIAGQVMVYDYLANQFKQVDVVADWIVRKESTEKLARKLTSYSAGWTGYLWEDRIIATAGVRRDINRTRSTVPYGMYSNSELWVDGQFQYQDVIFKNWNDWSRLSGTTNTYGVVLKPFLHWQSISRRSGDNLFWEFVENLGFSANQSNNFNAPSTTNVDLFGNELPKPQGEGKDWGVQFSLFKNKLYARVNWFQSTNENTPSAGALQRLHWHMDTTAFRGWLEHIYMINDGGNPSTADWTNPWTQGATGFSQEKVDAMKAWVAEKWGLVNPKTGQYDYNYYDNLGSKSGTISTDAKGVELTINYNPLPNWTIKATATKVKTANGNTNKEFDAWYAVRRPVWENAKAVDYLIPSKQSYASPSGYWIDPNNPEDPGNTDPSKRAVITNFLTSTNYRNANNATTITPTNSDGWTTPQGYYDAVVQPGYALERDLEGQQVMGQRKYSFTVMTNYIFDRGSLKGWSVGGAQRWASKAIIGYRGKVSGTTAGSTLMDAADVTQPIYDDPETHTDIWVAYTCKIFNDKVRMKLQLNVADVFENGGLKPVAVHYDGKPYAYRIVDSRQFILSATFDF